MRIVVFYLFLIFAGMIIFPVIYNFNFFNSWNIIFYRGVAIAILCALIQIVLIWQAIRLLPIKLLSFRDNLCITALSLTFNLSFFIIFPVTLERSISTFLLSSLSQNESDGLTQAQMEDRFIQIFVKEKGAISERMREQIASGNVVKVGDNYILTEQGRAFIRISEDIKKIYKIQPKYE